MTNIPEKLEEFVRKEVQRLHYELVDISAKGNRGSLLEIIIDKEGGITLEECSAFNRKITSWIDDVKMFERGCTLDVCSPGIDRSLKSDNDFSWARGKQVTIRTYEPVNNKIEIIGKLLRVHNEADTVEVEDAPGSVICIRKNNIVKAKLQVLI